MCKDQGKRTYESLASPDGPSFPCLLGHAQSRSMNDISCAPNTDQVVKPPHRAAVEGQGRKKPLVSGVRTPCVQDFNPMKEQESPGRTWMGALGCLGDSAQSVTWVLTEAKCWLCVKPWEVWGAEKYDQMRCQRSLSLDFVGEGRPACRVHHLHDTRVPVEMEWGFRLVETSNGAFVWGQQ